MKYFTSLFSFLPRRSVSVVGLSALLFVGAGCASNTTPTPTPDTYKAPSAEVDTKLDIATDTTKPAETTPTNTTPTPITPPAPAAQAKTMLAIMHTTKGDITIEFFAEQAPKTVENFMKLANSNFYDGIKFHRVIKDFMIQGGDPLTKDDSKASSWGTGGPGYKFEDEITAKNSNDIGTIAMANSGPNTNGSQFFINVAANHFLDSKHTVFGKVIKGMDVVTSIENTKVGAGDRPVEAMVIKSISIEAAK